VGASLLEVVANQENSGYGAIGRLDWDFRCYSITAFMLSRCLDAFTQNSGILADIRARARLGHLLPKQLLDILAIFHHLQVSDTYFSNQDESLSVLRIWLPARFIHLRGLLASVLHHSIRVQFASRHTLLGHENRCSDRTVSPKLPLSLQAAPLPLPLLCSHFLMGQR
jgi:hypothetical protein